MEGGRGSQAFGQAKVLSDFDLRLFPELDSYCFIWYLVNHYSKSAYTSLYYGDQESKSIGFEIFQRRFTGPSRDESPRQSRYNGYRRHVDGSGVSA